MKKLENMIIISYKIINIYENHNVIDNINILFFNNYFIIIFYTFNSY